MPVCLWLPLTTPFAPLTPLPQQLWEEMRREGCRPNVVTYNALIGACAQGEALTQKKQVAPARLCAAREVTADLVCGLEVIAKRSCVRMPAYACGMRSAFYNAWLCRVESVPPSVPS